MVRHLPGAERRLRAQLGSRPAGTDQASRPQKADRRSSCLSAQANTWRSTATQKGRLAILLAWEPPYNSSIAPKNKRKRAASVPCRRSGGPFIYPCFEFRGISCELCPAARDRRQDKNTPYHR